ncbi:T9SS type A sorting domain-containing protein [Chryseobacterium sp.]|uniref:Ig-like domain-containing protein n=1 Tax=Chryseobacterium sp. TaxID=1871047 RepID=UPI00388FC037
MNCRKRYAVLALSLFVTSTSMAQTVSSYSFTQAVGNYVPITGGTNMELLPSATSGFDSHYFHNSTGGINGTTSSGTFNAFPIGFNFTYKGTIYDGFFIGTDGYIRLGSIAGSATAGTGSSPISSSAANTNDVISAFGLDLVGGFRAANATRTISSPTFTLTGTSTGLASNITAGMRIVGSEIPAGTTVVAVNGNVITMSANATASSTSATAYFVANDNISYATSGNVGSRVLTVQWKNSSRYGGSGDVLNFQIKLFEGTNAIQTVYNNIASSQVTTASTVQVGLKGALSPVDYNNRTGTTTTNWSSSTSGTSNTATLSFKGAAATGGMMVPETGLTYTWTPPSPCAGTPTSGTITPSTQSMINGQTPAQLMLSGYSGGVSGITFQWQESSDNTTWTNVAAGTGATTSSYTPIPFAGATVYYRCVVTCSASSLSTNSASVVINPCGLVADFTQDFDSITPAALPSCWAKVGTTGTAYTQASTAMSGPNVLYIYSSTATNIAMVSMSPLSTLQSGAYKLKFKARSNSTIGGIVEVGYLTNPNDQTTFTSLGSFTTTSTTVPNDFFINNITAPAGVTILAFKHTGSPANGLFIDDVVYELMPTCVEPTAVSVATSTITPSGATVSWTSPNTVPANGYQVYYSTSSTAPTATTVLDATNSMSSSTTSASINGLLPSTKYYTWVRSVCVGNDRSIWSENFATFTTLCSPPTIITATGNSFCPGNVTTLNATTAAGANINWYDASTGGVPIATGNVFTTPVLSSTTNYYASAYTGTNANVGLVNAMSSAGYGLSAGLFFDAITDFNLEGVYVYPVGTGAGTVTIQLQNGNVSPATMLQTITVNLTGTATPTKTFIPLNFAITPGTNYKLMMTTKSGNISELIRESGTSWGAYPMSIPGVMSITGGNLSGNSVSTSYYYFYDWKVVTGCESARQLVTATADPALCLGTSESELNKNTITVYPNPFADVLTISDVSNVKSVSIIDIAGRLVKSIDNPSSQLQLSELKSGMFMIVLNMKDGSKQTIKAIKK